MIEWVSDAKDPYAAIAHLYEAEQGGWADDLDLYTVLARRTGGPVLDLGCGTGRVITPLAGAGFDVHGIDLSDALLAIAHGKARDKGVAVVLERADMRRLVVKRPYGLALCAQDTFLHLGGTDDHLDTVESAFNALQPGGILAIDIFHPTLDRLAAQDGVLRVQSTFKASGNALVTHCVSCDIAT
ncbi:MAG: class I SAM-dependent methyltransferase, partial [Actinobacteria bacterium]|nr:class I SAM-dependent methyltransferase [Actinomycetota bacterium]